MGKRKYKKSSQQQNFKKWGQVKNKLQRLRCEIVTLTEMVALAAPLPVFVSIDFCIDLCNKFFNKLDPSPHPHLVPVSTLYPGKLHLSWWVWVGCGPWHAAGAVLMGRSCSFYETSVLGLCENKFNAMIQHIISEDRIHESLIIVRVHRYYAKKK